MPTKCTPMPLSPSAVSVILVRPRFSENVGAVARALENVQGGELRIVAPNDVTLDGIATRVARGGEERLRAARCFATLEQAVQGFDLTVATSHRSGRHREILSPWDLAESLVPALAPRSLALVMGQEDSGLSREELDACHRQVSIPTHGPMNLAQATVVLLYELCLRPHPAREACGTDPHPLPARAGGRARPSPAEALEPQEGGIPTVLAVASAALRKVDYPHHRRPLALEMARLADILSRAAPLARWEVNFLAGLFRSVDVWATRHAPASGATHGPPPPS